MSRSFPSGPAGHQSVEASPLPVEAASDPSHPRIPDQRGRGTTPPPTTPPSSASPPAQCTPGQAHAAPPTTDIRDLPAPIADLFRAARTDDLRLAEQALAAGADLDARDPHDLARTPLLVAANHDAVEVARLLVASGAGLDLRDDQDDTAWLVTGVTGSVAMGEVLLAGGPDLGLTNRYGGLSPIPASERGHVEYVRWVVGTGVDINHRNNLGWTALLEAIVLGDGSEPYQQIVEILLAAGADPSIADKQGRGARDLAREHGYRELVRIIDQAGD